MSTNQTREDIGRRLGAVRSSIRRAQFQRGGLLVATVALGGLLAMMAADHFLAPLPVAARWAMFVAWLLATAAALVVGMRPLLRKIGLVQVARWIEGRHPEIEERMSTVLELAGSEGGASAELLEELAKAAGEDVGKVDARAEIRAVGAGRRWARPALVLALLFATLFAIWPKEAARLAVRAVAPFSNLGNAAAVKFEVKPGDIELLEGDALSIEIGYDGPADSLDLVMMMEGGTEVTQPMNRDGERWTYRMDPVREGFTYRARTGRGESDAFTVTMWPLPGIVEPRVKRIFPEYAGLVPVEEALGTGVEAVRGTRIELSGKLNTAVEAGWLEVEGKRLAEAEIERSATGGRVSFSWTLAADGGGEAVVTLKHRLGREVEALRFPVRVLEDQAPEVRWLSPLARELRVRPDEVLGLRYEVAEDYGVAELALEIKTPGKETRRIARDLPVKLGGSSKPARYRGESRLPVGSLLEDWPGAGEIRIRLRAADARPAELDGPGVGHSEWLLVRIDRNAESLARQEMRAEHEEAREAIEEAIRETREARQKMDQSRWEMKNEKLSKQAEKNFEEAREKLADTKEKLDEIAARMEESVHAAKADEVREASEQVEKAREELENAPLQDQQQQREEKLDVAREEAEKAVRNLEEVRNAMDRDRQKIEELARFQELAQQQEELARQAAQLAGREEEQQPEQGLPQEWQQQQAQVEEALRQQLREQPQARAEVLEQQAEEARELAEEARELSEAQAALEEQARQMPAAAGQESPEEQQQAAVEGLREALAKEQEKIAGEAAQQLAEARQERSEAADLLPEAVAATREASENLSKGEDQAAAEAAREAVEALKEAVNPSEQGQSEQGQSEQGQSEMGQSEQGQSEQGQSEQGQSEQGQSEQGQSEQGQSEQGQSEQGQSEQGQSEQGQSEQGQSEQGESGMDQTEEGASEAGPESGSQAAEAARQAEVEALAERQADVAEALEALAAGKTGEAMQALQQMQADEVGELAEAIAGMPQAEASGQMNEAANAAQQGSQQAEAAAESGSQGKAQDAAGQHQQAAGNLQRSAEALGRAAQEFAQAAEQARGQQPDANRAPVSPGDLAEAFQAASQAAGEPQASQAAGQAQQAAEAMSRAAQSAKQSMQGRPQPGQPGQPGQQPGQKPQEGPRMPEADPGVPPELAKLGISAADWEKIQATLKSDVGSGGGAGVPEEYRGLVKKYFEAMTDE